MINSNLRCAMKTENRNETGMDLENEKNTLKYINIAKDLIEDRVKKHCLENKITPEYFDILFPEVKSGIRVIAEVLRIPEVDDATLLGYYDVAKKEYLSTHGEHRLSYFSGQVPVTY